MKDHRSVQEQALVFECEGESLLGIISSPSPGILTSGIGIVIVVGGPQYRAGSHRQFVQLARTLASHGHSCLRFDYRGMGDSSGSARDFLQVEADIAAALSAFQVHQPSIQRFVLCGLCDAASAILLFLQSRRTQANITALCLLNPWVRSEEGLARAQVKHYYTKRLVDPHFWRKLLRHGIAPGAFRDFLSKLKLALVRREKSDNDNLGQSTDFRDRMGAALSDFPGPVLLILSGRDLVAKEFAELASSGAPTWRNVLMRSNIAQVALQRADHTFSERAQSEEVERHCLAWLSGLSAPLPTAKV